MARTKFRITHYPKAEPAHRFRHAIVKQGKGSESSEGYPSFAHAERAVLGLWAGLVKEIVVALYGKGTKPPFIPPVQYTDDSYKPKLRA